MKIGKIGSDWNILDSSSKLKEQRAEQLESFFSRLLEEQNKEVGEDKLLWEKAKEFESILIQSLLKEMRKTIDKNKLFHGGLGEDIFESLLDEEYSKKIAMNSDFGLAKILYEQLKSKSRNK